MCPTWSSKTDYFAAIVPLYNGETAPKVIRGTILVIYQVQIITGYATQRFIPSMINGDFLKDFLELSFRTRYT